MYVSENYLLNGRRMNPGNLSRLSNVQTRSISPENFTGSKGQGAMAIAMMAAIYPVKTTSPQLDSGTHTNHISHIAQSK